MVYRKALFIISLLMIVCSSPVVAQSGRTFYIDYANGSNSNPGTQTSPWKTHPYMNNVSACTGGSAPAYAHAAGDHFIFKGGSTWPAACFQMTIISGGTAGAVDYYGVCLSTDSDSPCSGERVGHPQVGHVRSSTSVETFPLQVVTSSQPVEHH